MSSSVYSVIVLQYKLNLENIMCLNEIDIRQKVLNKIKKCMLKKHKQHYKLVKSFYFFVTTMVIHRFLFYQTE